MHITTPKDIFSILLYVICTLHKTNAVFGKLKIVTVEYVILLYSGERFVREQKERHGKTRKDRQRQRKTKKGKERQRKTKNRDKTKKSDG